MSEKQKERLEELFRLIKENPDLPILPMVDSEIVADDGYAQWTGSWGRAHIEEYYITEDKKARNRTVFIYNAYSIGTKVFNIADFIEFFKSTFHDVP